MVGCDPAMTSDAFDEYNRAAAMPLGTDKDSKEIADKLRDDGADTLIGLWESPAKVIAYVTKAGKRAQRWYIVLQKNGDTWSIVHRYYDWITEPYEAVPPV